MSKTMSKRMPEIEAMWEMATAFVSDAEYYISKMKGAQR